MARFLVVCALMASALLKGGVSAFDGTFPSVEEACQYCAEDSFTKKFIAPKCTCTSYPDGSAHRMFCGTLQTALRWVKEEKGGCKCNQKDMQKMGAITCNPF